MSFLMDIREQKRFARERMQPRLWFTSFSVPQVLDQMRREHFPEIRSEVRIYAINRGPLACRRKQSICSDDRLQVRDMLLGEVNH